MPSPLASGRACLAPVLWSSCALGVFLIVIDQRLPTAGYLLAGLVQLAAVAIQLLSARFLTGVFGGALTAVLLMGVWIEWTPDLGFDAILTQTVYTPYLIARAHNVQLVACSLFHAMGMQFLHAHLPRCRLLTEDEVIASRRLLLCATCLSPLIMLATLRGTSIVAASYASAEQAAGRFSFQSSGLDAVGIFLVAVALVSAAWGYGVGHRVFIGTGVYFGALVFFFRLLRGDRSGALIFFATLGLLYYSRSRHGTLRKVLVLSAASASLFILYEVWGFVRASAHEMGLWNSIVEGWASQISSDFLDADRVDPLKVTLIPASYWHLLHCIDLRDNGTSLNGETIYALVPQAVPQFLADLVGFERPLNGAWRLSDYRTSAGAMYILAEGYWNFGLTGAVGVAVFFAAVCIGFERWFAVRSPLLMPAYFGYMGSFGYSIYYGLQPNLRTLQLAVLVAICLSWAIHRKNTSGMKAWSQLPDGAWMR